MLKWTDADEIGFQLSETFPGVDPLGVRFTELLGHVIELDEFGDDPKNSSEKALEAIQMAWLQCHQENK